MRTAIAISHGDQSTRLTSRIPTQANSSKRERLCDDRSVYQASQQATIHGIMLGNVSSETMTARVRPIRQT